MSSPIKLFRSTLPVFHSKKVTKTIFFNSRVIVQYLSTGLFSMSLRYQDHEITCWPLNIYVSQHFVLLTKMSNDYVHKVL